MVKLNLLAELYQYSRIIEKALGNPCAVNTFRQERVDLLTRYDVTGTEKRALDVWFDRTNKIKIWFFAILALYIEMNAEKFF